MNVFFSTLFKRYLAIVFFLSFFCIALSPYITGGKTDSVLKTIYSLFIYRFSTLSMISLLFATITTIQFYEKQHVCIAVSMGGISNWKMMQRGIYFSFALCFVSLFVNQYLYKGALTYLRKDKLLTANRYDLSVIEKEDRTIFFQKGGKDFTILKEKGDVVYAKKAIANANDIELCFVSKFSPVIDEYQKSMQTPLLTIDEKPRSVFGITRLKTCDSISKFLRGMTKVHTIPDIEKEKIIATFFYKVLFPFMHIFCFAFAMLIGFHHRFRKKYFLTLTLTLFSFLTIFYYIESTFILSFSNKVSLYYFIIPLLIIPSFTLTFSFLKKV